MNNKAKKLIKSFGSLVDIFPSTDYSVFVPTKTPQEDIRDSFADVGDSLRDAMNHWRNEQETPR